MVKGHLAFSAGRIFHFTQVASTWIVHCKKPCFSISQGQVHCLCRLWI